jgi:hypothetical protein
MGFGMPVGEWIRGPLRDWAEDLLAPKGLSEEGFFDPETVARTWQEHLTHKRNHHYRLWIILMFQSWYRQFGAAAYDESVASRVERAPEGTEACPVAGAGNVILAAPLPNF